MNRHLLPTLLVVILSTLNMTLTAQNPCAPIGEDWCVDAPLINSCQLNGWRSDTDPPDQTFTPGDIPQRGWCIENGFQYTIENNQWLSFIADDDHLHMDVDISECDGNRGIQLGCYEFRTLDGDCPGEQIACKGARSGENTSFTFYMEPLIPGNRYLIMIDGYGGDGCPFTLWISSGVDILINAVTTGLTVCPGFNAYGALSAVGSDIGPSVIYGWETENGNIVSGHYTLTPVIDEPGDYTFSIYDLETCCWARQTVTVEENTESHDAVAIVDRPIGCDGGTVTLSAEGSVVNENPNSIDYLYGWTDPDGNFSTGFESQATSPGIYNLQVIDVRTGCISEANVEVVLDIEPPQISPIPEGILNCNTTEINIISNAGPDIDTFDWLGPDGMTSADADIVASTPGTYSVTVTGTNGCTNVFELEVESDLVEPDLAATSAHLNCNTLSASVTATSADENIVSFEWAGPNGFISTEQNPAISEAGEYDVVATGANGCTSIETIVVTEDFEEPDALASPSDQLDCNILEVDLNGSSSTDDVSFSWTGPNGFSSTEENPSASNPGEYTLTVTAANGCTQEITATILEDLSTPDVAIANPDILTCNIMEVSISGSSISDGATFEWTGSNGFTDTNAETMVTEVGVYTLVVTGLNGCTSLQTVEVSEDIAPPLADAGPDNIITCQDTEASLNGSASAQGSNISYLWLTSGGTEISTDANFIVNNPGTYTLVVTNLDNGCTSTDEVLIDADESLPIADAGPEALITCLEQSVTLDGSNSSAGATISYEWIDANGNLLGQGPTLDVDVEGTFTLIVSDSSNGCVTEALVEVVEDTELPIADPGIAQILNCDNTSIELDGSNSTGHTNLIFNWQDENGTSISTNSTTEITDAGTYSLLVTDPDNGCTSLETIQVDDDFADPVADPGNPFTITCTELTGTLNATNSQGANLAYSWINDAGIEVGNTAILDIDVSGNYTLLVTNQDNGCTNLANITIDEDTDFPLSDPLVSDELNCNVTEVVLDVAGSTSGTGITYEWIDENGLALGNDVNFSVNSPGTYSLVVTNTANDCSAITDIEVLQDIDVPSSDAGQPLIITCDITEVSLDGSASSVGGVYTYEWTNSNGLVIGSSLGLDVSNPDVYSLLVTNTQNGCTAISNVEVTPDENIPLAQVQVDGILNCNAQEVLLSSQGSSNGGTIVQSWYDQNGNALSTDPDFMIADAGVYTLQVIDESNGCSSESSIEVVQDLSAPDIEAGDLQVLNCEILTVSLEGTASANSNNSTGNLIYSWQDASGTELSSNLEFQTDQAGIYTLVVTDPINGCSSIDQVEVGLDNDLPNADPGLPATLTCEINSHLLGGSDSSSGADISYTWLDQSGLVVGTNLQLEVTTAGTYTLQVLNNTNQCEDQASVTILEDAEFPQADAGPSPTLTCEFTSQEIDASSSDQGPEFTYEWFDENGNSIGNEINVSVDDPGEYQLIVSNTLNGCSAISTVMVNQDIEIPLAEIPNPDILTCTDPFVTISADGSSAGNIYTYEWLDQNMTSLGASMDIEVSTPGNYTLYVINTQNGCSTSAITNVATDDETPIADPGLPQLLTCDIQSVDLDGSNSTGLGNLIFSWTTSSGQAISDEMQITVNESGEYHLQVTDLDNGCESFATVMVGLDVADPLAEAGDVEDITCNSPEQIISALGSSEGPDFQYEWTDQSGNVISNNISFTTDIAGQYNLLVTNTFNGCSAIDNVVLLENLDPPIAAIEALGPLVLDCNFNSVILDGSNSTPFPNITFEWFDLNGNLVSNDYQTEVTDAGMYNLYITDIVNGCTHEARIEVSQDVEYPIVDILPPDLINCYNPSAILDAQNSSIGTEFEYIWSSPTGGQVSDASILNPEVEEAGTYELTILNTENGCERSFSIDVDIDQVPPEAEASVDDELDCVTPTVDLSGLGSSQGSQYTYQWSGAGEIQNANGLQPTVNTAGEYEILVTNISNGCTSLQRIEVPENDAVPTDAELELEDITCFGFDDGSIEIIGVIGGTPPYLFSFNGSDYEEELSFPNLGPGSYPIQVIDATGCEWETELSITEPEQVYVELGPDMTINLGDIVELNALSNGTYIDWETKDELDCLDDCFSQTVSPFETTTYFVEVTDKNGCPAIDEILLRVDKTRAVYIPNAFSPDGDGINDFFTVYDNPTVVQVKKMLIADRWGEIVFIAENFAPEDPDNGWTGVLRGEKFNPGVFVYYAEVEFIDGFIGKYKGDVTLMR